MASTPSTIELELDMHANIGLVRPGDTLVIALDQPLSKADAEQREADIAARLPGVRAVFITGNSIAVYRPAGPALAVPGE